MFRRRPVKKKNSGKGPPEGNVVTGKGLPGNKPFRKRHPVEVVDQEDQTLDVISEDEEVHIIASVLKKKGKKETPKDDLEGLRSRRSLRRRRRSGLVCPFIGMTGSNCPEVLVRAHSA